MRIVPSEGWDAGHGRVGTRPRARLTAASRNPRLLIRIEALVDGLVASLADLRRLVAVRDDVERPAEHGHEEGEEDDDRHKDLPAPVLALLGSLELLLHLRV